MWQELFTACYFFLIMALLSEEYSLERMQDKIKFSLIVSYNAAFNQKMLAINNRQEEV
jgi:hypothetical protein